MRCSLPYIDIKLLHFIFPGGTLDCAAHGVPPPSVTWVSASAEEESGLGGRGRAARLDGDLARVLPHNNSLWFRPFHAAEFRPEVHEAKFRWVAKQSPELYHKRML